MFFRRKKSPAHPAPPSDREAQRAAALERLARFAAQDAAAGSASTVDGEVDAAFDRLRRGAAPPRAEP